MPSPSLLLGLLILLLSGTALPTQRDGDDLRDVLELENGRELRGRLRTPFALEEYLVMQGGRRRRVDVAEVKGIERVHHRLATFNQRFATAADNAAMLWMLAEWAASAELPEMADLAAWRVLTLEHDHAEAHERLGHRQHARRGWLYRDGTRWLPLTDRDALHDSFGKALEVRSENFLVRTNAGHACAVDTLLDLERLYVWLFAEYGQRLQLVESLAPMVLHVHASADDFPKWGFEPLPYFVPPNHGDHGATWRDDASTRPVRLFEIGTQMILSRCLTRDQIRADPMNRDCASLELGFAQYVQGRFAGLPGRAEPQPVRADAVAAELARNERRYELPNLLHLGLRSHFYGALLTRRGGALGAPAQVRESTNVHWASAGQFVTFLLDGSVDPARPAACLEWMRRSLAASRGDSSDTFDTVFGLRVEEYEDPFREWLVAQGARRLPKRR